MVSCENPSKPCVKPENHFDSKKIKKETFAMKLIPLFKKYSRKELCEQFSLSVGPPDEVTISFPYAEISKIDTNIPEGEAFDGDSVAYLVDRYRADIYDADTDRILSAFIYLDESTEEIVAIDDCIRNMCINGGQHIIAETPFQEIVTRIQNKS